VSNRHPFIRRPWSAALAVAFSLVLLLPAAAAAAGGPLNGWLSAGPHFPQRAAVLFPSSGKLSSTSVRVTENGVAVRGVTATPVAHAGPGDFGLLVVVDHGQGMRGLTSSAFAAVRSLSRLRRASQQLGVVTASSSPSTLVPLTSDQSLIGDTLAFPPTSSGKADLTGAVQNGLSQLNNAGLALGAIVVISNGTDISSSASSAAAVTAAATSANVPVFTVGLKRGAGSAAALAALNQAVPGRFVTTRPAALPTVLKAIDASVTRGYVVRWHSGVTRNGPVAVSVQAAGQAGQVSGSYAVSGLHAAAPIKKAANTGAASGHLATTPSFAQSPVAPPTAAAAPKSFWASPSAVPAVSGLAALLFGLALMFALYRPSHRAVRVRVGSFIPVEYDPEDDLDLGAGLESKGLLRRLEQGRWWPPFVLDVDIAQMERTPVELVKRAALVGLLLGVIVGFVSGSALLGMVPILGWPFVLRKWVKRAARKQREKFKDSLPNYLQDLSSAIRVGRSFVGALTVITESADQPTRAELERAITDEALGRPIDEALDAVAARMDAVDLSQVALIAALNRRSGSNVAEALDRVAEGARERGDLRREVRALTAQAKMSSSVLTALPGLLLIGVNLISAKYAYPLLHTTLGVVLLVIAAGMVWGGWKVMNKITEIKI
jgi:tight adherence protein B